MESSAPSGYPFLCYFLCPLCAVASIVKFLGAGWISDRVVRLYRAPPQSPHRAKKLSPDGFYFHIRGVSIILGKSLSWAPSSKEDIKIYCTSLFDSLTS